MTLGETNDAKTRVVYFQVSLSEAPTVNNQELCGEIKTKIPTQYYRTNEVFTLKAQILDTQGTYCFNLNTYSPCIA